MIQRFIEPQLQRLAAQFPVITIIGPRQSGKTTLAQHHFNGYDYVNWEEPEIEKGTVIYAGELKRSGEPAAVNFRETAEIIPE